MFMGIWYLEGNCIWNEMKKVLLWYYGFFDWLIYDRGCCFSIDIVVLIDGRLLCDMCIVISDEFVVRVDMWYGIGKGLGLGFVLFFGIIWNREEKII